MKAAFHFDVGKNRFGNPHGERVENLVFSMLLERPILSVFSKIYAGDLLLNIGCSNEDEYFKAAKNWMESAQSGCNKIDNNIKSLFQSVVYIVCFDAIDKTTANILRERLSKNSSYLTAILFLP